MPRFVPAFLITLPAQFRRVLPAWLRRALGLALPWLILLAGRLLIDPLATRTGQIDWAETFSAGRLLFSALLFAVLGLLVHRVPAAILALAIEKLLLQISDIKLAQTGDPLLSRDVMEISQGLSMSGYMTPWMAASWLTIFIAAIVGLRNAPNWRLRAIRLPAALLLPAILGVFATSNGLAARSVQSWFSTLGIHYYDYNFPQNIRANGVLAHLALTTESAQTPKAGPHSFTQRQVEYILPATQPDVITILCEGCFTSMDERFVTPMARLAERGFSPLYMLSPVYGGGTAEAEFETMTGLSSAILPGIDYQNYAQQMRTYAAALPRRFADSGYQTSGMHNFLAKFWKRNLLYPKLGFQEMRFIEDMNWTGKGWPDDQLVFDAALASYRAGKPTQPRFMYLITVHTHGPFQPQNGDFGEGDYRARLDTSIQALERFIEQLEAIAKQRKRPLAIVVYGDHKPALSGALLRKGVLPAELFSQQGADNNDFRFALTPSASAWQARAQTSVFIRLPDAAQTKALQQRLAQRPLFCLPGELAGLTSGKDDVFWRGVNAVCQQDPAQLLRPQGNLWQNDFPRALYGERLF